MKVLLKEVMHEKRISYRRLAILTNIKRSTLHDIATEKTSPRLKDLEVIAEKLEVKITDLFESPYKWKKASVCSDVTTQIGKNMIKCLYEVSENEPY